MRRLCAIIVITRQKYILPFPSKLISNHVAHAKQSC